MPTGEQGDQRIIDDSGVADDDLAYLVPQRLEHRSEVAA